MIPKRHWQNINIMIVKLAQSIIVCGSSTRPIDHTREKKVRLQCPNPCPVPMFDHHVLLALSYIAICAHMYFIKEAICHLSDFSSILLPRFMLMPRIHNIPAVAAAVGGEKAILLLVRSRRFDFTPKVMTGWKRKRRALFSTANIWRRSSTTLSRPAGRSMLPAIP
jgi:hypothetical protein